MSAREERKRTFALNGSATVRNQALALLRAPGDGALVIRGRPRWFIIKCPCGCGENISINLDSRTGPAWRYYQSRNGFTLFPSVWRESGCKSHFVIWANRILWFDGFDEEPDESGLEMVVLGVLNSKERHFAEIADQLNEIPWDVLAAARGLVRRGLALETPRDQGGWFKKTSAGS
jgi:hypothetical protein